MNATLKTRLALAALLCGLLPLGIPAQEPATSSPSVPVSQTTLTPDTPAPMTKDQLKAQRKAQKQQEKAADANAKAAKSQAKAKKDQNKALQEQEKATGVVPKS